MKMLRKKIQDHIVYKNIHKVFPNKKIKNLYKNRSKNHFKIKKSFLKIFFELFFVNLKKNINYIIMLQSQVPDDDS